MKVEGKILKKLDRIFDIVGGIDSAVKVRKGIYSDNEYQIEDNYGNIIFMSRTGIRSDSVDFGEATIRRIKKEFLSWDVLSWKRTGWRDMGNQYSTMGQWELK